MGAGRCHNPNRRPLKRDENDTSRGPTFMDPLEQVTSEEDLLEPRAEGEGKGRRHGNSPKSYVSPELGGKERLRQRCHEI